MKSGRIEEFRLTFVGTGLHLAGALAVILVPLNAVAQETDSERWEQVGDCEDLISVEMFLLEYPDSPLTDDARNCLAGVQLGDAREEEPENETLESSFNPDTLTGSEKRFLQTGLALIGYYWGMLDGEWGNRSQKAIEEFARVEFNDTPRRSHSAALAYITSLLVRSGWQIRYVNEVGISLLAPGEDFERAGESRFFQNWEDPASSLRYSFARQPKVRTLDFHRFAEGFSSGDYPTYEVRKPDLLVTRSVDADGSVLYARSDLIRDAWATVMLSSNSDDANLLSTIASSIAVGTQPPLELPETGNLTGSLRMFHVLSFDAGMKAEERGDHATALQNYRFAAERGHAEARFRLGRMLLYGSIGVREDPIEGIGWLRHAAAQGHADAQFAVGEVYERSAGARHTLGLFPVLDGESDVDESEAVFMFRLAANQGHAEAQTSLGFMHFNGEGVEEDPVEAARLLRMAARQGSYDARLGLGFMYYKGLGVEEDPAEAARLLRMAGYDTRASYLLGAMYHEGDGVEQDLAMAASSFRDAAMEYSRGAPFYRELRGRGEGITRDAAISLAQASLGFMYYRGKGVEQNDVLAAFWLSHAQGSHVPEWARGYGFTDVQDLLNSVLGRMSRSEISDLEQLFAATLRSEPDPYR